MYTAIFSNFSLFGENKNWRIVTEERQIVYRVYTENFIVNHTQSVYPSMKVKSENKLEYLTSKRGTRGQVFYCRVAV